MKFNFSLAKDDPRLFAVSEIMAETGCEMAEDGIPVEIVSCEKGVELDRTENGFRLAHADRSALIRGLALLLRHAEDAEDVQVKEEASFDTLGTMMDMSRNAVMKPVKVKQMIRLTALMGFNAMMLYTEDTYEVKDNPYFGHLRGRYSTEALKDLDAYAKEFGVEMIPCMQTLAHLGGIFKWPTYQGLVDWDDILNTADDRVYVLIDQMISSMRDAFTTDKINIGMDEAYMLGRGHYADMKGHRDSRDVMFDHLGKVMEICRKYGFKPRMWSDMFFRMCTPSRTYYDPVCNVTPEVKAIIPDDMTLVYWDYYSTDRAKYDRMFTNHFKLSDNIAFAGGASSWYGMVPLNLFSVNAARAAMIEARKCNMKEIYVTMWGDNGGMCSEFATFPTLVCYGENNWNGRVDEENLRAAMKAETGCDYDSFINFEEIENLGGRTNYGIDTANPHRYMFYNDVLQGRFDWHVLPGSNEHFAECRDRLISEKPSAGRFGYLYDSFIALCDALSVKAELGLQLKAAYDAKDRAALEKLRDETIPVTIEKVDAFHDVFRTQWMTENSPFGFEVEDIRLGGLKARLVEACATIDDYLAGRIENIEELDAARLPRNPELESSGYGHVDFVNDWSELVSASNV